MRTDGAFRYLSRNECRVESFCRVWHAEVERPAVAAAGEPTRNQSSMSIAVGALSLRLDLNEAVDEVADAIRAGLDAAPPTFAFVFTTHDHVEDAELFARRMSDALETDRWIGCAAESVIANDREIEQEPALSVMALSLPDSDWRTFHIEFGETPDGIVTSGWVSEVCEDPRALFVLADPYSTVPESLIDRCAEEWPGLPMIGGMASGAGPGEMRLFVDGTCKTYGAVCALLASGPSIRTVVSQGCRPIGRPMIVTAADGQVIHQLGGRSAVQQWRELIPSLSERDVHLARQGLHLGIAISEYRDRFERGDFLITNVLGADPDSGAIVIGGEARVGQTVQFHVRDAASADEDLVELLKADVESHPVKPAAALLITCNGRGRRMFPVPNHDAATLRRVRGKMPLGGFFAQGEFGPVAGQNHLHGFTASAALFDIQSTGTSGAPEVSQG